MSRRSSLKGALQSALTSAIALAIPRSCVACGGAMSTGEHGLACGACWSRLPLLPKPWCERCGHPAIAATPRALRTPPTGLDAPRDCPVCRLLEPRVARARSVCWVPHAHSSLLLGALKYQGWWGIADAMAERMVRTGRELVDDAGAATFVPVPLAAGRQRERGFNQSAHLAQALARRLGGKVLEDALVRVRATVSQTQLTPAERRANVHHAFVVPAHRSAAVTGLSMVLVDDVLTTGATLNACATALFESGASDISYWTFGRARSDADRP